MKLTQDIINKCGFTREEGRVIKHFHGFPLGNRAERWLCKISEAEYNRYLADAHEKLDQALSNEWSGK